MAIGSDTKHVDVTMAAELHARLSREAERRGMTLAGFLRHAGALLASRTLDGAQQPDVGQVVAEIDRHLRALVPVLAAVAAWVREAEVAERDDLTQLALAMFDNQVSEGPR